MGRPCDGRTFIRRSELQTETRRGKPARGFIAGLASGAVRSAFPWCSRIAVVSDMHVLVHGSLGKLVLFLTAVHVSPGILAENHPEGRFYESVIN